MGTSPNGPLFPFTFTVLVSSTLSLSTHVKRQYRGVTVRLGRPLTAVPHLMYVVVVVVVLFDLTLRDVLFLFSTRLDVSSSSSSSSSCRRRRRRLRRRRRQHSKHTIPWCDCPLGPSPNGALASCVFASSYITTWLKAQDGGGPLPILLSRIKLFILSLSSPSSSCSTRRLLTPFSSLTRLDASSSSSSLSVS